MAEILAIALVVTAAAGILLLAAEAHSREQALERRVGIVVPPALRRDTAIDEPTRLTALLTLVLSMLRSVFTIRMRRSWGVSTNPLYLLAAGAAAATLIWLTGNSLVHLPRFALAAGATGGFFLVPRLILVREQHVSDRRFGELLPDAIDTIVRIVRAGLPVATAIRTVWQDAKEPLRTVFAKVTGQIDIGMPLDQALRNVSEVIDNPDFRFFAVAVSLQQSTGGNLAATLETLSQIVRRRRAVRLKARAATAEVKISAIVLGSIPLCVIGALLLVAPSYLSPLFVDFRGNIILGLALLGLVLAGAMMRTMIRNSLNT